MLLINNYVVSLNKMLKKKVCRLIDAELPLASKDNDREKKEKK